ncbi:MAG TPA: alpha-amylase family glycosyl hydrolase, partial [Kribbella sp.]|nr:alpha-amylase family glycosyl hydrolase [Kribbella sp.]
ALGRHDELLDRFVPQTFVGNHDVTRLATRLEDERHVGHALAILFAVAGVPSIYSGDEQAFQGLKEDRAGGDDAIRPAFPDTPAELAAYGWPTYRLHQRLIGVRRRNPWLTRGRTTAEHLTNQLVALRTVGGDSSVLLLLNISDEAERFPVDASGLAVGAQPDADAPVGDPLVVPAHSWRFLTSP